MSDLDSGYSVEVDVDAEVEVAGGRWKEVEEEVRGPQGLRTYPAEV